MLRGVANAILAANYISNPMTTPGDLIIGGAAGVPTRLGIGTATQVLHGGAAAETWGAVVEADLSFSNNATANATAAAHGLLPILSNVPTQFLNGQGNFTTPSGTAASYSLTAFVAQTSVNVVHNFGTYPVVAVLLNTGAVEIPLTITHNTLNDFTVTFTSATTGNIIASVGSPQPQANAIINSATYTVLATDNILRITSAAAVVTLLTAVGNGGRMFWIKNSSAGNVTVNTTSSQTIDNQLTQTLPSMSSMTVYSDGANWWII